MEYGSLFFIVFYACMTIAVLSAITFSFMAVYRMEAFGRLLDIAFRSERRSIWDEFPPPLYHPRRVWRITFVTFSILGFGIVLYTIFIKLFGWMPYDWRTDDDMWSAYFFAAFATGLLLLGLFPWGGRLQDRIARYKALERYRLTHDRFENILAHLLACPPTAVDFWAGYGECFLSYHSEAHTLETGQLIGVIRAIKAYRHEGKNAQLDDQIRLNLVNPSMANRGYEQCCEPSQKAVNLIEFIVRERDQLELFDDGRGLQELMPKSPDGWRAPDFRISQRAYNDNGPVLYAGGTWIGPQYQHYRERLIENILWADRLGAINQVNDYLRNHARWEITRLR